MRFQDAKLVVKDQSKAGRKEEVVLEMERRCVVWMDGMDGSMDGMDVMKTGSGIRSI